MSNPNYIVSIRALYRQIRQWFDNTTVTVYNRSYTSEEADGAEPCVTGLKNPSF